MMIRTLFCIAAIAGSASAERVAVKPLAADAVDLAAAIEARLATEPHVALREITPTEVPAGLGVAIEVFRDGDCATATVQVAEVARTLARGADAAVRGHVGLWHAAILQRCDRLAEANAVLDTLVREQPTIAVDLGALWPSFAELVERARERQRSAPAPAVDERAIARDVRRRSGADVVVLVAMRDDVLHVVIERAGAVRRASFGEIAEAIAWTASMLAPPRARAFDLAVGLIAAAGHETRTNEARQTKLGSGLVASVGLQRGLLRAELETRAIRYAAPDGETHGGYELGAAARIGGRVELGGRVAVAGFGVVQASSAHGGRDHVQMVANVRRLGVGLGGGIELRATSRLRASLAAAWIPVGLAGVDDAMGPADAIISANVGARLGCQVSRAWLVDVSSTIDQHETELRTDTGTTQQSDMTISIAIGMRHTY